MAILVVDAGTSGVRVVVVDDHGAITHEVHREQLPITSAPGLMEFDADALATAALDLARDAIDAVGTVDSWLAWHLSGGTLHVTDASNASGSGFATPDADEWDDGLLAASGVPRTALPRIVDSSGVIGPAPALDGAPPLAGLAGDQSASLVGQGCTRSGMAKITFGTGGMLDLCIGASRPGFGTLGPGGSVSLVAWRSRAGTTWMLEGVMLTAGTAVEWLRDGIGLIDRTADAQAVADQCDTSEGVTFVPALLGLGTPYWDFDARGTLTGISRGTTRPHIVRAVLEGVAQRAADLVEAAEADSGLAIEVLRVDGGMTANEVFVQAVADATGRPVEVAPVTEATALGAARLASWAIAEAGDGRPTAEWVPSRRVEPRRTFDRNHWREACRRAGATAADA